MYALNESTVSKARSLSALLHRQALRHAVVVFTVIGLAYASNALIAAEVTDPLEPVNRASLKFNRGIDTVLIKPLARSYDYVMPKIVKTGVRNFFDNLGEVGTILNDVLQLQFGQAANSTGRLAINSTIGLGGLIEVADPLFGMQRHKQDFGRTLAAWGVESGPYVVLPLLGPSTVRDAFGFGFNASVNPAFTTEEVSLRDPLLATQAVDTRAGYLPFDELIFGDEYLFIREAYLQSRQYQLQGESLDVAFEDF